MNNKGPLTVDVYRLFESVSMWELPDSHLPHARLSCAWPVAGAVLQLLLLRTFTATSLFEIFHTDVKFVSLHLVHTKHVTVHIFSWTVIFPSPFMGLC